MNDWASRRDAFHHNLSDINYPDPATNYMHVDDTTYTKRMIYRNDVDNLNGLFCYVLSSSRLVRIFESVLRRR